MNYVIIGGSAAGISCIEGIRQTDKKSKITLISDEKFPLYSRCLLSYLLAGVINESNLNFKPTDFFEKNNVEAMLGVRANSINPTAKIVTTNNKKKIEFDKLLIATGARSKMLDIPGVDKKGVFALRTVKDSRDINAMLKGARTAVVLGGGLIGLRAAYALNNRGIIVKVIVKSKQIFSQVLDVVAANLIQGRVEQKGITVMKGLAAKEILGKDSVEGVILDDGTKLECDLVVIGKGVEPNLELTKTSGVKVKWGIVVDDYLQTSVQDIFAAGDVAETNDITSGEAILNAIWPAAIEQGKIAGKNMAGKKVKYNGSVAMNSVEFFGLPVISMGTTKPKTEGYEQLSVINEKDITYKKVILKDDIIRGFISVGKVENSGVYNALLKNKVAITEIKDVLLHERFNYAKAMPLVKKNKEKFNKEEFKDSIITY